MDLKGLHGAIERKSYHYPDRDKLIREEYAGYGDRLRRIADANKKNNYAVYPVNIAHVSDSPLGTGRLSARVTEYQGQQRRESNWFRVEYYFTPVIPRHSWDEQSYPEKIFVEHFNPNEPLVPQLDAMLKTTEMLETAILTDGMDNETLRERYEAHAGWELWG